MSRHSLVWVIGLWCFAAVARPAYAQETGYVEFMVRDSGGNDGPVYKLAEFRTDTTGDTCHGGMAWCIRTVHDSVKLQHLHFLEDFTSAQQADADRYIKESPDSEDRGCITWTFALPTTIYNCHAWALYGRTDIWLNEQYRPLWHDYNQVGPPPVVGDVCEHADGHSSKVWTVSPMMGILLEIKSKWGGYGLYASSPPIYGGIVQRWRWKP